MHTVFKKLVKVFSFSGKRLILFFQKECINLITNDSKYIYNNIFFQRNAFEFSIHQRIWLYLITKILSNTTLLIITLEPQIIFFFKIKVFDENKTSMGTKRFKVQKTVSVQTVQRALNKSRR